MNHHVMETRADGTTCKIIHSFNTALENNASLPFGVLLRRIACSSLVHAPTNATVLDLSALFLNEASGPRLYTIWMCPVSTPSIFSTSCVCEHIRRHLRAENKMIVTLFNDLGSDNEEVGAEPGTYLVALKKVEENQRCVPVNFSKSEKAAINESMNYEEKE